MTPSPSSLICRTVTTLTLQHSSKHTSQRSPFIRYSMRKCDTEKQKHFFISSRRSPQTLRIHSLDRWSNPPYHSAVFIASTLTIVSNVSIHLFWKLITFSKKCFRMYSVTKTALTRYILDIYSAHQQMSWALLTTLQDILYFQTQDTKATTTQW